jgi:uncharacterized phage infection (PIP) family protein YhgE
MKIKSGAQAQKPKTKTKINKKRLFFIFFSAFVGFFFLCTLIASLITPKIDVPALNEGNLSSVSSDDFKGRIDPRLKLIEMDEGPANVTSNSNPFQDKTNANMQNEVNLNNVQDDQNYAESQDQNDYSTADDQLPYDSREKNIQDPTIDDTYQQDDEPQPQPIPQPKKAVKQVPRNDAKQQDEDLILRDKVKVQREPASMNKVMVGNYSDLTEARRVSQELTNSELNVTPFIKEVKEHILFRLELSLIPKKLQNLPAILKREI